MRKVIVSMNITLDGYIAGPQGELDWHFENWHEDMAEVVMKELYTADTILLGRITYQAMANYWPTQEMQLSCSREDIAFAVMMNNHNKIVYSNTLQKPLWNNSCVIKGDIKKEILSLKNRPGKHIIIFGSGKLVTALIKFGLIDEYQLWIHPVMLGKGRPLMKTLHRKLNMELIHTLTFNSGVILCYYNPKPGASFS